MSYPTQAGTIFPLVIRTAPIGAAYPRWASGIRAAAVTKGWDEQVLNCSSVSWSRSRA